MSEENWKRVLEQLIEVIDKKFKQEERLEEKKRKAEKHIVEYKQKHKDALQTIDTIKRNVNYYYISKLELERKLEEVQKEYCSGCCSCGLCDELEKMCR